MKHLLASLSLLAWPLVAAVIEVSPNGPIRSIQQAIELAEPGSTIRVLPGEYHENIVIRKPVVLEGVDRPLIRGDGTESVITVYADGTTIRGFHIEHSGNRPQKEHSGIILRRASHCLIEDNQLRDVLFGIYLLEAHHNVIRGNRVEGWSHLEYGQRGNAYHVWNSSHNQFSGNKATGTRDGLYFEYATYTVVRRNHIYGLRYGLHYMFSDHNVFEDNTFERNVAGAAVMYSKDIQFRRNYFLHNRGFSSYGILFQGCDNIIAEENLILDNAVGLFMEALKNSTFRRNHIAGNDVAIQLFASSSDNAFHENNFLLNLSPLLRIGRDTQTRWCVEGRGNYWSQYEGYDLDGDGVGDVPFKIQNLFQHLETRNPRLRLYLYSPAAQALVAAEKAFPVFEGSAEYDPCPLMKPVVIPLPVPEQELPAMGLHWSLLIPLSLVLASAATMLGGKRK